jgi:DNA-binding response OmpR family regulator
MKKILVVDDDPNIITALTVRLEAARYEVLSAPDGFKGLQAAVTSPPDLILLDVCLPAVIGFAVAQQLQVLGLHRQTGGRGPTPVPLRACLKTRFGVPPLGGAETA